MDLIRSLFELPFVYGIEFSDSNEGIDRSPHIEIRSIHIE